MIIYSFNCFFFCGGEEEKGKKKGKDGSLFLTIKFANTIIIINLTRQKIREGASKEENKKKKKLFFKITP